MPICSCVYCLNFIGTSHYLMTKSKSLACHWSPFTVHSHLTATSTLHVFKTLFPKHLTSFLSHACLCLLLSLCLKCFFDFSSLILLNFFSRFNSNVKFSVKHPFSAGKVKCYVILLLSGLGCIQPSSSLWQTLKTNMVIFFFFLWSWSPFQVVTLNQLNVF